MLTLTIKLPKSLSLFSSIAFLILFTSGAFAQDAETRNEVVKFGIGIKAVATSELLSGGATAFQLKNVDFGYEPNLSQGVDAIVRFKLKDRFSFQTGISSTRRSYSYNISTDTSAYSGSLVQTSFQMPFTGLLQVQINDKMRIGTEAGYVAEMFPGDIATGDDNHYTLIYVRKRLNSALKASAFTNYELNSGAKIELGLTYHRMLGRMGTFYMDYEAISETISAKSDLQGHYFALNLAYFFR